LFTADAKAAAGEGNLDMIPKWMTLIGAAAMICASCSRSARTSGGHAVKTDDEALQKGLAVRFTFENGITNSGSARYPVTAKGVSIGEKGRFGAAGRFGNEAFVSVAQARITPEGSWCLWMRPDADQKEPEQRVLDANGYVIGLLNRRLFVSYHDGKARTITGPSVQAGVWTHVAMTWGTESLKMYVNGELLGQHMLTGKPGFPVRTIHVGVRWTGSTRAFSGLLDDICIYERALSDDEVKRLASEGLATERPSSAHGTTLSATASRTPVLDGAKAGTAVPQVETEAADAAPTGNAAEPAMDEDDVKVGADP
jgi:hypothetical protein